MRSCHGNRCTGSCRGTLSLGAGAAFNPALSPLAILAPSPWVRVPTEPRHREPRLPPHPGWERCSWPFPVTATGSWAVTTACVPRRCRGGPGTATVALRTPAAPGHPPAPGEARTAPVRPLRQLCFSLPGKIFAAGRRVPVAPHWHRASRVPLTSRSLTNARVAPPPPSFPLSGFCFAGSLVQGERCGRGRGTSFASLGPASAEPPQPPRH